ncbi:uncharacterized protein CCR75_005992 [Bremia lactucae]|uniref:Uncharacterized protein n=1 Tax=Bremia lactucae TaxID=4779 RepID=A0A976FQT1_BRELC|nr:hypothetical protein CCR75_005992 [Bremia lactucae]
MRKGDSKLEVQSLLPRRVILKIIPFFWKELHKEGQRSRPTNCQGGKALMRSIDVGQCNENITTMRAPQFVFFFVLIKSTEVQS